MESLEKMSNQYADGAALRDFINEKKAYKDGAMAVMSLVENILDSDCVEIRKTIEIRNLLRELRGFDTIPIPKIKEAPIDPEIQEFINDNFFKML